VLVQLTLFHHLLAALVEDTTKLDRLYSVKPELHFIRRSVVATGLVLFVSFAYLNYGMDG
jgi:hypothetical protein